MLRTFRPPWVLAGFMYLDSEQTLSPTFNVKEIFVLFQTFFLLHEEGFFVGASSGLNVAAAVKVKDSMPSPV